MGLVLASSIQSGTHKNDQASIRQKSFTFSTVGDFDVGERFEQTLDTIKNADADFTLALGDLSYSNVSEQAWCDSVNQKIKKPFQLVVGNHDVEPRAQIDKFSRCLPNKMGNIVGSYPDRYYFDYKNLARFIVVSPNIKFADRQESFASGSTEYTWLKSSIAQAREHKMRWVIVAMHENCLTVGEKACEIGQDLADLLISQRVDLILQGHEHGYMRSKQLVTNETCLRILPDSVNSADCVDDSDNSYRAGAGSVIAIVGTGGAALRDIREASPARNLFATIIGKNKDPAYGVLTVIVTEQSLQAKFVKNISGEVGDSFSIAH